MRLCIPTRDAEGTAAALAQRFGTAPFFTFVDVESGICRSRANPDADAHPGGCHHVPMLQEEHVQAVVGHGIGHNAREVMRRAGITVLQPVGWTVADVLAALHRGELQPPAAASGCCGHGHGAGEGHGGCGCGHGHHHDHHHDHPPATP